MKNTATLIKEMEIANRNMVNMIKKGNIEAAEMWAKKLEQLEKESNN